MWFDLFFGNFCTIFKIYQINDTHSKFFILELKILKFSFNNFRLHFGIKIIFYIFHPYWIQTQKHQWRQQHSQTSLIGPLVQKFKALLIYYSPIQHLHRISAQITHQITYGYAPQTRIYIDLLQFALTDKRANFRLINSKRDACFCVY